MYPIAQVVITKTKQGNWNISVQSLKQVEAVRNRGKHTDILLIDIKDLLENHMWENLSLD